MTTDDVFWWRADALCPQTDPALFFLELGDNGGAAKKVCRQCPVRAYCLAESLIYQDEYGIWGGFGRNARRELVTQITPTNTPLQVATAAIEKEKKDRERRATNPRRAVPRRRSRDRLHEGPRRRAEERTALDPRRRDPT